MEPEVSNFESFSKHEVNNLEVWKKRNKPEFYKHPEFGILPYNAPCKECVEILEKRTANERYYLDIKDPSVFFLQKSFGDINTMRNGYWVSMNPKLNATSPKVFETILTDQKVGIDVNNKKTYIETGTGKIFFNQWKLIGADGQNEFALADADWSNYTAGDDGVVVHSIFPGIDAEFQAKHGGIKTNFIIKQNNFPQYQKLIFRDLFAGSNPVNLKFADSDESISNGQLNVNSNEVNLLKVEEGIAYLKEGDRDKIIILDYSISGAKMDMIVPMNWIAENIGNGDLIIDPLVSGTATATQASILGSQKGVGTAFFGCDFGGSCDYNLTVAAPAMATFTDVTSVFSYRAQGACYREDGAIRYGVNGCLSPNQVGYYWFCNVASAGVCNGNNSIFSDIGTCLPAPSCASQNIVFTLKFYRSCYGANGCDGACIGANSPWVMTLQGRTLEYTTPVTPITLSATTVCQGQSITATAGGLYGVGPYTYNWSLNASGTPSSGTTASVSIPFPTSGSQTIYSTVTDACGTVITSSRVVTITAGPTATAGGNSPICSGGTLNLTANTVAGATYSWTGPGGYTSNVQNPTVTNVTVGGTYTLTITSAGCSSTPSSFTVVVDPPPTATAGSNSPLCPGATLNLTANTVAGATYSWTGPGGFTSNLQNPSITNVTAGGTYTLTITSGTCASTPSTVTVVVDAAIVATPGSNSPICSGGTLNLTANTIAGATYSWTGPGGYTSNVQNPTVTNVTAGGTYTVTITNGSCSSAPASVTVVVGPLPTATAGSNSPVCLGGTLNLTGNTIAGATYSWTGPGGYTSNVQNPTVTNVTVGGTYTLTVTNGGCVSTPSTVTVVVTPLPVATAGSNSPICSGGTLNLTGNTIAGATYSWTGPGGYTSNVQNPTVTNVTAGGTYTLTITSGGCVSTPSSVTVVVNPAPTATAGSNSPICAGATLNLTGNTVAGATYSWTGPGGYTSNVQNPTVTNVTAGGTYTLTITNAGCASAPSSVTVVVNPLPVATAGSNSPICVGGTLNLTGNAVAGATYSWTGPGGYTSNVQNPPAITNVTVGGTYTLTITNGGCVSTPSSVTVVVNAAPVATAGSNSPICSGATLNLTANTIAGATYSWTGPGGYTSSVQNPSITNVTAGGTYILTITSGCASAPSSVTVVVNPAPTATAGSNSPICSGATLNLTGNTVAGATYSWTGPGGYTSNVQNPTITNATAGGTYTLTITNGGCASAPATVAVVITAAPTATAGSNSPVCLGNALNLTGNAVAGATYSWTGPNGFTSNVQNPTIATTVAASAGTYTLTITNGGCASAPSSITVVLNTPTALAVAGTNVLCNGGSTGSATATPAVPGTYTYTWSPSGGSAATASNLAAGTYTVSAVSASGCTSTATVTITQPVAVSLTTSSTQTSCASASGTATVVATGGTGAYTYSWSPSGGTGATATGLTAGTYTVTVKDANNCTKTATATVGSLNAPTVTATSVNPTCFGVNDGSATAVAAGGTPGYTYLWAPSGGTAAAASNLGGGTYTVTVTDNAGCTAVGTVNVVAPAQPALTTTGSNANCGSIDGSATATVAGGTGTFTYLWQPGNLAGQTINNLAAGTYTVKATDANGCSVTGTYVITINGTLNVSVTPPSSVINEGSSVNLTSAVTPNVPGIVYTWTPPAGLSCTNCPNPVASPAQTTTYTLTATAPDGCTGTVNTKVSIKLNCGEHFLPTLFSPNGDGINDEFGVSGKCVTEMSLKVYNRWGQIVFESKDQLSRWDGTYNGERLNSGAFVYTIDIVFADGRQISDKGSISLVR